MPKSLLHLGVMWMVVLGVCVLTGWSSSAEAVITIRSAEVVNGVAVVQGGNAARSASIYWEGALVTQANNGGNFAFQGVVPADCVGSLHEGDPAAAIEVALANCEPVSDAPAPVPQTGQTQCYSSSGSTIPCAGTRQDGEFQAGVAWPVPRFTDQGNGTVRDNLTGLVWLQNGSCFPEGDWFQAMENARTLASGQCGLTDGSVAGDWRLPNVRELQSLIDFDSGPIGHGPVLPEGYPFVNASTAGSYWSATSVPGSGAAYTVSLFDGRTEGVYGKTFFNNRGWFVRVED